MNKISYRTPIKKIYKEGEENRTATHSLIINLNQNSIYYIYYQYKPNDDDDDDDLLIFIFI